MTIALTHAFVSTISDGGDATLVQPSNWNAEHVLSNAGGSILGSDTSSPGVTQELPLAFEPDGGGAWQVAYFGSLLDGMMTGAIVLPTGDTADRPATPQAFMVRGNTDGPNLEVYVGGTWQPMSLGAVSPGLIYGLIMSAAGGSAIFNISAGFASDSTAATIMKLAAAITKNLGAWVVGNNQGALDTGTAAPTTTYHVFAIINTSTGVVDILASLSPTAPTLPSGYTNFRRIGSMLTDSSSDVTGFTQNGDEFLWLTMLSDQVDTMTGVTPFVMTPRVPTGIVVNALTSILFEVAGGGATAEFYSPSQNVPGWTLDASTPANAAAVEGVSGNFAAGDYNIRTNTSGQFLGVTNAGATPAIAMATRGWIDNRGRYSVP